MFSLIRMNVRIEEGKGKANMKTVLFSIGYWQLSPLYPRPQEQCTGVDH